MTRPDFPDITSGQEFNRWYWLKSEMQEICRQLDLPATGRKFDLRDRIMYALDHDGALLPAPKKSRPTSIFDWANETLAPETVITDNVTFGPNFRSFFQARTERKFTCTSDFMDWVHAHPGRTLADGLAEWNRQENRKRNPAFQRDIARNNMYCQYVRDFYTHYPEATFTEVREAWLTKRNHPMTDGRVIFEASDHL